MVLIEPGLKARESRACFFDHRKQHTCVSAGQNVGAPGAEPDERDELPNAFVQVAATYDLGA
jgi:hypothetical protein